MDISAIRNKLFKRLQALYQEMEREYQKCASLLGLSCQGCADNCCLSYFQHHTNLEWAYLWQGVQELDPGQQRTILKLARKYVEQAQEELDQGRWPEIMCPLNKDGLCMLYEQRMMICRLHGVPNRLTLPNGQVKTFPGCIRSQELSQQRKEIPFLDRTIFYYRLALLEKEFVDHCLGGRRAKVDLTLAQILLKGPP